MEEKNQFYFFGRRSEKPKKKIEREIFLVDFLKEKREKEKLKKKKHTKVGKSEGTEGEWVRVVFCQKTFFFYSLGAYQRSQTKKNKKIHLL